MSAIQGIRMKNPAHPGGFVKTEIIEALGLSVTDGARVLGVTRPALSALLNERVHLSPEMALRIEKAFGVSMDTLMRMQNSYDIAQTRKREGDINLVPFEGKRLHDTRRFCRKVRFFGKILKSNFAAEPLQERIETVGDEADLQEVYDTERHLLYVACTRARDHLLVTSVMPASEFLDDMQGAGMAATQVCESV